MSNLKSNNGDCGASGGDCETINKELWGIFYEDIQKKCKPYQVILSSKGMLLRKEMKNDDVIDISNIVGSRCMGNDKRDKSKGFYGCPLTNENAKNHLITSDNIAILLVHCYEPSREKRLLTLGFSSYATYEANLDEANKWDEMIQTLKGREFLNNQNPILILLNPKSGAGRAIEIFYKHVMSILVEADLPFEVQVTRKANSSKELMKTTKDINNVWRGIIVVGGDGLFWEIINGLLERDDCHNVLHNLPIGIIPCGSGNGLARTISHLYQTPFHPKPINDAAISCVSGRTSPMDIVRVQIKNKTMYSFLSIGWGFIADVDIESEILRSIGFWRFTLWSLYRAFTLKSYHGILSYKRQCESTTKKDIDWTVEEGNFIMVHAAYQTHLGEDCFFVPQSKLNDGLIYLVVIREGITRLQMIRFLSALSTGTHIQSSNESEFIALIPTTAFRIEPSQNEGILTVDGERVEYGSIQGEILPGLINVMVPK